MSGLQKISIFIYSMAGGGAERVVSNLLTTLKEHYELHLILMNDRIFYKIPDEVKIHYIEKSAPFESGILKFLKLPFLALKYKKLCKELGIDLHFVWMNRPCYVAGLARVFGDDTPLIINECSTPSVLYSNNSLKSKISKYLLKWLYPKADFIYPNSVGNLIDLKENFNIDESKMAVLYNAIDLDEIKKLSTEKIDYEAGSFFLSVGRLDSGKNHALIIKAFSKLKNNDKKLLILGDGILRDELQNLINSLNLSDRVKLLGFDNNPYKYMSKCYAFVFASLFEGFSNVLIEALACERLVITSDHKSGAKELIGDDEYGILTPVNDELSLINAMQKALDCPDYVKFYEKKAKIRADKFDKFKITNQLLDKFKEIYEKKKF